MYEVYARIRDEKGLTDYAVAKAIDGLSPSTLSDWKNGLYVPKVDKLLKIARLLGIPVEELIETKEG